MWLMVSIHAVVMSVCGYCTYRVAERTAVADRIRELVALFGLLAWLVPLLLVATVLLLAVKGGVINPLLEMFAGGYSGLLVRHIRNRCAKPPDAGHP